MQNIGTQLKCLFQRRMLKLLLFGCCLLVANGGKTYVIRGNFTVATPFVVSCLTFSFTCCTYERDSSMRFLGLGFRLCICTISGPGQQNQPSSFPYFIYAPCHASIQNLLKQNLMKNRIGHSRDCLTRFFVSGFFTKQLLLVPIEISLGRFDFVLSF